MHRTAQYSPADFGTAGKAKIKTAGPSCDLCKRMKIKCDWQDESCKHCSARGVECTVTPIQKKKRITKRADYLATLEDRIKQMETALDSALATTRLGECESIVDQIGGQAGLSDKMSTLVVSEEGTSQFIGASSGFSLFSPRGLQWIRSKVGASDAEKLISAIDAGNITRGDFSTLMWRSRSDDDQEPLPSKHVADQYVDVYFQIFGPIFPVYEETKFRGLYERQYSLSPPKGVAWYASLNAVLALGSAILQNRRNERTMSALAESDCISHDICWRYFRNASSKFTDLIFKAGEIMAIQAILCMAFMCQVISDPQPSYILAAAAVRLSHAIGLHRSLGDFGLNPVELKERQNVLWVTYLLDAGVSLKTGRPPAMNDQNIAVALPSATSQGYDHFRWMATLALLETRIYSQLYSAEAGTRSGMDRLRSIGRLDTELTQWRDNLPKGYQPESHICCPEVQLIPVMMMHFAYYNCITAIHRASIHHGSWTSEHDYEVSAEEDHDEKLNPRVYISSSLCLEAARNVVGLLKLSNQGSRRNNLIWMAIYYPLSAALVLFANALQNPQSADAILDIESMAVVIEFLNQSTELSDHLQGTIRIFAELYRIAGRLVQDKQMTRLNNLKRRYEETADHDSQKLASAPSRRLPARQFSSPEAGYDSITTLDSYNYGDAASFDQRPDLFAANTSSSLPQGFPHFSTDMWTEPAPEDLFSDSDGYIWYM